MKNPLGLSVLGSAIIAILCGIAGANYTPKEVALQQTEGLEEGASPEAAPVDPAQGAASN